jgi:hypothetical protein
VSDQERLARIDAHLAKMAAARNDGDAARASIARRHIDRLLDLRLQLTEEGAPCG